MTTKERFMEKVIIPSPCWEWAGNISRGYGHFWIDGKMRQAHRVAWELFEGPIPPDMNVLHMCDHPACVNPKHLFLGTQKDNYLDAVAKGRMNLIGEANGNAHLRNEDVREIRRLYATGKISQSKIGAMFGVAQRHVCDIVNGEVWVALLEEGR